MAEIIIIKWKIISHFDGSQYNNNFIFMVLDEVGNSIRVCNNNCKRR